MTKVVGREGNEALPARNEGVMKALCEDRREDERCLSASRRILARFRTSTEKRRKITGDKREKGEDQLAKYAGWGDEWAEIWGKMGAREKEVSFKITHNILG